MGAWGPGLYSDDVTCDVKDEYLKYLKEGKTNEEATREILESWEVPSEFEDDTALVLFALADTQWNYGRLLEEVKELALKYIDIDLKRWEEDKQLYNKRKKVLEKLEVKLKSPQPPLKKIHIPKFYRTEWQNGDTFAYRFEGEYAKEKGYEGKYIYFVKTDECWWDDYHIIPRVHVYNLITDELLKLEEIVEHDYLPQCGLHHRKKEELTYFGDYFINFINTSNRVIPKNNLIFIGNNPNYIEFPDNYPNVIRLYCEMRWKEFEEYIINVYINWNE